jgi:hypothetical protein
MIKVPYDIYRVSHRTWIWFKLNVDPWITNDGIGNNATYQLSENGYVESV